MNSKLRFQTFLISKVTEKNLNKVVVYDLWTQCPECGANESELAPEDLHFS
ncbi:hypothetical protein SAMN05192559_11456 [Halobacillus karajensis]|nr:hypothetical protein SAMN05192559_11456 [Halobacillus karajensis]